MYKKLNIAVFHNLPAGGAIKALQDNISFLKTGAYCRCVHYRYFK